MPDIIDDIVDRETNCLLGVFQDVLRDGKPALPLTVVVVSKHPTTDEPLAEYGVVPVFCDAPPGPQTRRVQHATAQAVAIAGEAVACISLLHTWAVTETNAQSMETKAALNRDRRPLAEHPDRVEVVVLTVETVDRGGGSMVFRVCRDQGFVDFETIKDAQPQAVYNSDALSFGVIPRSPPPLIARVGAKNLATRHIEEVAADLDPRIVDKQMVGRGVFETETRAAAREAVQTTGRDGAPWPE